VRCRLTDADMVNYYCGKVSNCMNELLSSLISDEIYFDDAETSSPCRRCQAPDQTLAPTRSRAPTPPPHPITDLTPHAPSPRPLLLLHFSRASFPAYLSLLSFPYILRAHDERPTIRKGAFHPRPVRHASTQDQEYRNTNIYLIGIEQRDTNITHSLLPTTFISIPCLIADI
jgi:hypothetical protein